MLKRTKERTGRIGHSPVHKNQPVQIGVGSSLCVFIVRQYRPSISSVLPTVLPTVLSTIHITHLYLKESTTMDWSHWRKNSPNPLSQRPQHTYQSVGQEDRGRLGRPPRRGNLFYDRRKDISSPFMISTIYMISRNRGRKLGRTVQDQGHCHR
jgi:hypothetical protein